ncbi:MAG: Nif3-like dinuclear metal center hexameric protein [Clostridia bacterium]|nr:Nif3-like dinuclear metal center hexameric protein [Clostridia bacterium]
MKVCELYDFLENRIPKSLSCEWDNDGLMCCPDREKEVRRVLVALDVTSATVEYAVENGYDVIISHHPFIYKGLRSVDDLGYVSSKLISLIESGISVMSFHTRLDAVSGGVNDRLCELLDIRDAEPLYEEGIPLGRVGTLESTVSSQELALKVKSALGSPFVLLSGSKEDITRVAVVGGSGKDMVEAARAAGADALVSGRLDYHPMTDAFDFNERNITLIEAGHFYTENPVCEVLRRFVADADLSVECDVYCSNVIKAI